MNYDIKKLGTYLRIIIAMLSVMLMFMMFRGVLLVKIMNNINEMNDVKTPSEVLTETAEQTLKENNADVSDITDRDAVEGINGIFGENGKALDFLNDFCK